MRICIVNAFIFINRVANFSLAPAGSILGVCGMDMERETGLE